MHPSNSPNGTKLSSGHDTPPNEIEGDTHGVDLQGLDGLTLYEKKCVLINREIEYQGMGRYQWYIWCLCGFGYLLDLLWAQAFGLALSPLQQELGFSNSESGNIGTSFNAGMTAGAFVWGFLADIVGRRWAFNLTCLIASVFGLCLGASHNYNTFLVLTAFVGFGVGGNIPIDTTITLEFIPKASFPPCGFGYRLAFISTGKYVDWRPIGVVLCSAIAFGFIPVYSCSPNFSQQDPLPSCRNVADGEECCSRGSNMGWRYLLFTIGAITLSVFILRFFVFTFRETPKYLIYRGQDAKAIETLHHMGQVNKRACKLTLAVFESLTADDSSVGSGFGSGSGSGSGSASKAMLGGGNRQLKLSWNEKLPLEMSRYKMLFDGWQMTRLTILVWLTYIMDYWAFTVAGFYLPRILALKNGAIDVSLTQTYAAYIYTYVPGIFGVLLGALMYHIPSFGRKWTLVLSAALMSTSIFLLSVVDTRAKNEGLFTMEYFFQSMFNAVLYGWTPEAFPAPGEGDINAVLYLAGGVMLGCVVTTALLPTNKMESTDARIQD
ncbi:Actin cytoskeleton-regulatory complex protein END3 [Verticillium dahliae VDG1]|nr:Actin cytoskeleton-regulatory complex protein END3 [Verticillium dahliae VDG1]